MVGKLCTPSSLRFSSGYPLATPSRFFCGSRFFFIAWVKQPLRFQSHEAYPYPPHRNRHPPWRLHHRIRPKRLRTSRHGYQHRGSHLQIRSYTGDNFSGRRDHWLCRYHCTHHAQLCATRGATRYADILDDVTGSDCNQLLRPSQGAQTRLPSRIYRRRSSSI